MNLVVKLRWKSASINGQHFQEYLFEWLLFTKAMNIHYTRKATITPLSLISGSNKCYQSVSKAGITSQSIFKD